MNYAQRRLRRTNSQINALVSGPKAIIPQPAQLGWLQMACRWR
jgi:hypothetical protein